MKGEDIEMLKEVLDFLNEVPNRVYGENYLLAPKLTEFITKYEITLAVLKCIRTDAEMAIDGSWDCSTDEGREGFNYQIELINKVL